MKTVMYHYVRPQIDTPPFGYFHLDIDSFRRQLDHFDEKYTVLGRQEFLATVDGDRTPRSDDILLTFDDGLIDHAEYVLPELRRRDLFGAFYVPAGPYLEGMVLHVQ
jgi:peptidoglycan/xylan/chitin deacetylase (PgdA/CDA1 family)